MFKMVSELRERMRFWSRCDRIGPDIPTTHWRLYFPSTMRALCLSKFKSFGEGSEFRAGAYAVECSEISIGKRVKIHPGTILCAETEPARAEIRIEDDVLIGSGVHIYVSIHRFDDSRIPIIDQGYSPARPVVLCRGCWIGAGAIILPGVTVGENSVIGAGSIVTKSIPALSVAVGNPARVIKTIQ